LGTFYEEQLQVGVKRMSALIEPALILVIGGIVGFVYYAFFQAMFSLVAKG
jgi:type IV pilus assembly protein PilC